jgi:hypothetical protein
MELSEKEKSIFDGLMLSDGNLSKTFKNARFSLTSKYKSFIEATINNLPSISWGSTSEKDIYDKRTNKFYHSCRARSHVSEWLTVQYERWYPCGVKVVPKDIIINKDSFEWWYIGDGHLCRKKTRPNYRRIIMATDSFNKNDKTFLKDKLINFLGNDVYIENERTIVIAKDSLVKIAKMLKNPEIIDYAYKYDFGNYIYDNYHEMAMISRGPVGGRPKGSKDKTKRKKGIKYEQK